jgi:hypothetical protein
LLSLTNLPRKKPQSSGGADDGIRTHTELLALTDFKSVASTVPPHRQHIAYVIFTETIRRR